MARATCVLCGADNRLFQVYRSLKSPQPNLVAIDCTKCGKVSSQLRTLGDYAAFASIYSLSALPLVAIGITTLEGQLSIEWIAAIGAVLPFFVLPGWWANRVAQDLAGQAPQQDLPMAKKLGYMLIAIAIIAAVLFAGLFAYLTWIVEPT